MNEIKNSLKDEVLTELTNLSGMELGTEEYRVTIDGIAKLADRFIDLEKVENEDADKKARRELEDKRLEAEINKFEADIEEKVYDRELKSRQMDDERMDQWIKNGIAVFGIVVPLGVTIWGTVKTLKFEQEGTVTSLIGRGFINKLLPKK